MTFCCLVFLQYPPLKFDIFSNTILVRNSNWTVCKIQDGTCIRWSMWYDECILHKVTSKMFLNNSSSKNSSNKNSSFKIGFKQCENSFHTNWEYASTACSVNYLNCELEYQTHLVKSIINMNKFRCSLWNSNYTLGIFTSLST